MSDKKTSLAQRIISGGRVTYSSAVTLDFLLRAFENSLPSFKEKMFPPLEAEEKAIDEIADFIVHQVTRGETWWVGGFSFAIYPPPAFLQLTMEQNEEPGVETWGRLTLTGEGSEVWFPLDGYQRMLGLLRVRSMLVGQKCETFGQSMIPVLLLPDLLQPECYEMISRMHKSARAINRGKAIRTIINDDYATYAHWMMGEDENHQGIIEKDLINWKSNTLTNRLEKFSTLSVLYDSAKMLDQVLLQSISEKEQRYDEIAHIWLLLLRQFALFNEGVRSPRCLPTLRAKYLCLKPTGQLIVVAVAALALRTREEFPLELVVKRLNAVPWEINHSYWQNIAVVDGRIKGTSATVTLTSRFVAYLIGLPLSDTEIQKLEEDYRAANQDRTVVVPEPLFPMSHRE